MKDNRTELNGKEKFLAGLSSFLETHKKLLLIVLAAFVAIIIIVGIVDSVTSKKAEIAASAVEQVQSDYDDWLALEEDDEAKASKLEELTASIDNLLSNYSTTYAQQRGLFIEANVSFQNKNWTKAAEEFKNSAEVNPDSYMAPIALMLSASSYENAESYEEALELYKSVYENYNKVYADVTRAMLAIGRLNEQLGDNDAAIDAYNKLLDEYPGSGWASFARTRIIQIN